MKNKLTLMLLMTGILAMMIPASAPFAMANGGYICDDLALLNPGMTGYSGSGDVIIPSTKSCTIIGEDVFGEVKADDIQNGFGPVSVIIEDSKIRGNVQIKGATGTIRIIEVDMDSKIRANLQISESNVDDITVENTFFKHGNIQIEKNIVSGDIKVNDNYLKHGNIQLKENVDNDGVAPIVTENIEVKRNTLVHGNIQLEKEIVKGDIKVNGNMLLSEGDVQLKTNQADGVVEVNSNTLAKGSIEVAEIVDPVDPADSLNITVMGNELTKELKVEKNRSVDLTVTGNTGCEKSEFKDNVVSGTSTTAPNCP